MFTSIRCSWTPSMSLVAKVAGDDHQYSQVGSWNWIIYCDATWWWEFFSQKIHGMFEISSLLSLLWINGGDCGRTAPPTSMSFLSWNWWGLGSYRAIKALCCLVKQHNPHFIIDSVKSKGSLHYCGIASNVTVNIAALISLMGMQF